MQNLPYCFGSDPSERRPRQTFTGQQAGRSVASRSLSHNSLEALPVGRGSPGMALNPDATKQMAYPVTYAYEEGSYPVQSPSLFHPF